MRVEIRHAVREAALGWMASLEVILARLIERFRPWRHGDFNSTRTEVLEVFAVAVSGNPYSGQIRLAVLGLRRRGREIGFSGGCSRNPRSWVMQPLRGEW